MTTTATRPARRTGKPTKTREQRRAEIQALADQLTAFADSTSPADLATYEARFDSYSPRNAQMIVMQRPDATVVRGYHAWRDLGRQVRKGEHGIAIFAPRGLHDTDTPTAAAAKGGQPGQPEQRMWFGLAYVFDLSQTDPME